MDNLTHRYIQLYRSSRHDELADWIEELSWEERINLRNDLFKRDIPAVRGLSFDYKKQDWIS